MQPSNDNMSPKFIAAAKLREMCLAYNQFNQVVAKLPMEYQRRFDDVIRSMGTIICEVHDAVEAL